MAGIGRQVDTEGLLDRISNLPDHLIDRILGKLPLSAVVRTSILSKRWKDCWKRLRKIEPDMCFFNEFIQMDSAIYAILVLHNGPLDEFILIVPFSARACHFGDASKWLMLLSKKYIKDLTLCGFSENRIIIPSHIFSCLGLKSLHLIACDIKRLDSFGGFKDLTSLTLDDVIIPDALLQILISNSPLLEALKLAYLASGDPVLVDGPKLRKLMFISETRPLLLKYSPSCTEVQIESELIVPLNRSGQSKLNEFVCLLPKVEKLNLAGVSLNSLGVGFARVQFPSTLHHLKHLELTFLDSSSTTHISSAFYLIQSAPNLESLGILIHWTYFREENEAAASMLKAQERACNLSRLRKVEFTNLHVSENELLLVKAALRCFPMLDTVTVNGGLYLSKEEEVCVVERLLELQVPGSPVFKFRYIGNEPVGHLFNCQEGDLYWRVN
uniref:F-box domain-containing protein n=1 Tax=Kalanchoe fedtschenkoi TaxID=63787 RepID=A0A7N0VGI8_KALFE